MKANLALFLFMGAMWVACGDNHQSPPPDGPPGPDGGVEPPRADPAKGAWRGGFTLPGASGFGARVEDVAISADGKVAISGIFHDVAGVPARNVATWTGSDWAPLGPGLEGWARAAVFDSAGVLWAAATADDTGSAVLARWSGTAWIAAPALDGMIFDLAVAGDAIVAVGSFTGGVRAYRAATNQWQNVTPNGFDGFASAIAATPTGFCVAGVFASIDGVAAENAACWDGAAWSALGSGLPGGVSVLARAPNGTWFAGGTLVFEIDPTHEVFEAGIAALDGATWQSFEGGIGNGYINHVRTIAFDGQDVLVGGQFRTAGKSLVLAENLARWSPIAGWSELGGGLLNDVGLHEPSMIGANDLAVAPDGKIWVGGLYSRAGGQPAVSVATVAGDTSSAVAGPHPLLGVGGPILGAVADRDGSLVAGGDFAFAGKLPLRNVGRFKGGAWSAIGDGVGGIVRQVILRKSGQIGVAGTLTVDGEATAYAEWNGTAWTMPGGAVDGNAYALVEDSAGTLWIAGDLFAAGGAPVKNIAKLAGAAWAAGGSFDNLVSSLAIYDGKLIAAGLFTMADGQPAAGIAIGSGAAWSEFGGGLDGETSYINTLAVSPALGLVVGGQFPGLGGVVAEDLARWDGAGWKALGSKFDPEAFSSISALAPYKDGLFVAGGFADAGGGAARHIAWYDGARWHSLGTGIGDLSGALVVIDDALYLGGPFTTAGDVPASGLAVWDFKKR